MLKTYEAIIQNGQVQWLTEQPDIQSGRVFITFLENQSTVIDRMTRLIPFPKTTVDQVSGYLNYSGPPKSLEDFEAAIAEGLWQSLIATGIQE
jgi:hypothetical protein